MPEGATTDAESEAVLAFIRDNQARVLASAITEIEACGPDDLPRVVHAVFGTLGSYQLPRAHAAVSALSAVLKAGDATPAEIEAARDRALAALRALAEDGPG